jgi:ribonuclease Z
MADPLATFELRLVNGSTGDPALFLDRPGRDDALLFDAGENASLGLNLLGDLSAVLLTHHHVDHFIGFDRIVRANIDRDKALRVYGPEGTIRKVYDRIKSYEYPFFPFQKIVLEVHEILPGLMRSARLECAQRFPRPVVSESDWKGPLIWENGGLSVEATHVDHTVPCLAFAAIGAPDFVPDRDRLTAERLRAGPWVGRALALLRTGAAGDTPASGPGGAQRLADLKRDFVESPGWRIAYVTDTAWSEQVRPALLRLAQEARRLYCDSFYAHEHLALAQKHRHMTATQAAEFAALAGVEELVLIHFSARYEGRYEALLDEARAIFPRTTAEIPPRALKKTSARANRS